MAETIKNNQYIIFFDGVCNLCNFWVRFVIKNDPKGRLYFASLQSELFNQLIQKKIIAAEMDTIIFHVNGKLLTESEAIIAILHQLGGFYRLLSKLMQPIPVSISNVVYRLMSRNRYFIFGKRDHCMIPDENLKNRFL